MGRKHYTREFKLAAVRMITEQGLSVAETARKLDVSETCLRNWLKKAQKKRDHTFPDPGTAATPEEEIQRLRALVCRLEAERDLLKKAAAYFASHPS